MKALIIGASSEKSIGYHIGERMRRRNHHVAYASRSGSLGFQCDITDPVAVQNLVDREQPNVFVHAAGLALRTSPEDTSEVNWADVVDHLAAKSVGPLTMLEAARRVASVTHFVSLGGREMFEDPRLGAYAVANGALWAATQFISLHMKAWKAYYIDMPLVLGTGHAEDLVQAGLHTGAERAMGIPISDVVEAFDRILEGSITPGRVMLSAQN